MSDDADNRERRQATPPVRSRRASSEGQLLTGRLIAHGAANYQFRRDEDLSYYVKLQTDRGERIVWGKDLERAIAESTTRAVVGDLVGVRRTAREAVTITQQERNQEGQVIRRSETQAHRNQWAVEKPAFFAERARLARRLRDEQLDASAAVREHPELKSTFLTLRAAQEFANQRIAEPKDRERFVEFVKGAIEDSIRKGAPLPTLRLRDPSPNRSTTDPAPAPRTRSERTR
jgi:hypothetical protein